MSKNAPKSGHSARRGNTPAPYTKRQKAEFDYSGMYRKVMAEDPPSEFAKHLRQRRGEG